MSIGDPAEMPATSGSVSRDLQALLDSYRRSASSAAELLAAEVNLAASSAVLLLGLSIAIALFLATAWIICMLAIAAAFVEPGAWALPLALIAAANLIAAYGSWLWVRSLVSDLTFCELRGLLKNGHDRSEATGDAE